MRSRYYIEATVNCYDPDREEGYQLTAVWCKACQKWEIPKHTCKGTSFPTMLDAANEKDAIEDTLPIGVFAPRITSSL
jgi:phage terminase large subunit-like protein